MASSNRRGFTFDASFRAVRRKALRARRAALYNTRCVNSPGELFTMTRPLLTALALALFAALPARAQSLQELYDAALSYDATYLAARALADSAVYRAEQVKALGRPRVGLSAVGSRAETDPPQTSRKNTNTLQAGLTGEQWLFNRANAADMSKADKALAVEQANLQIAEQDLIVRLAQNYFDVLAAQDALTTAQANKKAIGEQLASAKRNFEVGTATITDTREAQARFDLATAQEIAADNDLRTKRIALDQLVGRTNVQPKPLAAPVALPATQPSSVDFWVGLIDQAPSVRKAQLGYDVAQLDNERAKADHLPTVKLEGGLDRTRATGSFPELQGNAGNTNRASLGVRLTVPLYEGGKLDNRVKETVSLQEQARNNLDAARRGVAQSTRQVFFGVESGQAQVKALEAAESSSKLALEATQLGYRVGVRVNLDVLNAQTQLFTTQRDLSRARYDVVVNSLRLRQAAGNLQPGDVSAVNSLLAK
jgi:outer membrane protein